MSVSHEDRMGRQDGHRYDAPEPDERQGKTISYAVLGVLVVAIMVLVATGTVPIFAR